MKTFLTLPALVVALSILSVGCTKKRDPKLADGAGRYSDSVSNYDGKVFPLETLNPKTDASGKDIQLGQKLEQKKNAQSYGLQDMPMVDFRTEAKLPAGTRIYAIPNKSDRYFIEYELTNEYLVLHKVAKIEDLPLDEKTLASASKTKQGMVRVPVLGYPIQAKIIREVAKNALGERTSVLEERSVETIQDAQFVKIDFNRPTEFTKIDKKDVLPAEYLNGEWYFGQTIIAAPDVLTHWESENTTTGLDLFYKTYGAPNQSIVKLHRTENGIQFLGTVVAEEAKKDSKNLPQLAFLPATPASYRVKELGNSKSFAEEEDKDVPWQKAQYVKVDWKSMNAAFLTNIQRSREFGAQADAPPRLAMVQLEDNYISLSYDIPNVNIRVQISLWKVSDHQKMSPNYQSKIHFESDWKRFGIFATNKPTTIESHKFREKEDYDKIRFMNRYNPNMKKIVYHITEGAPEWTVEPALKAIQRWNDAFKTAETNMTIEYSPERVQAGDIRKNAINFISNDSDPAGGSGGVAQVIVNPFTGEIVSAKANVWHNTYKSIYANQVNTYILANAGVLPNYFTGIGGLEETFTKAASRIQNFLSKEERALPAREIVNKLLGKLDARDMKSNNPIDFHNKLQSTIDFRKRTLLNRSIFDEQAARVYNIEADIKRLCPDIDSAIQNYKTTKDNAAKGSYAEKCGTKIAQELIVPVILHEMGHTFGLRHNFRGSVDKANWTDAKENGTPYPSMSSSIMDYSSDDNDRAITPGYYDIAAIRFAYADKVGMENGTKLGQSQKIDITKSLEQQQIAGKMRIYQFCSDETIMDAQDPLCERFDAGTTPSEIVDNYIKEINESFMVSQNRNGRAVFTDSERLSLARVTYYMVPMMKFYETWRVHLHDFMGGRQQYLEGMTKENFEKILEDMKADPKFGPLYAQYRPAAEKIYKFLKNLAMLPDRYCVVKGENQKLQLIELSKVRGDIYKANGPSVNSCKHAAALDLFAKNKSSFVAEFGYHVKGLRYDMSADAVDKPLDVYPTELDRIFAAQLIGTRNYWTKRAWELRFAPNIMDEPTYRENWMNTIMNRVVNGLDANALDSVPELKKQLNGQTLKANSDFFSLFSVEKDIISFAAGMLKNSMWIPGNIPASLERMLPLGGTLSNSNQEGATKVSGGLSFSAEEDAYWSKAVLMKFMQIEGLKKADPTKFAPLLKVLAEAKLPSTQEALDKVKSKDLKEAGTKINAVIMAIAQANKTEPDKIIGEFVAIFGEEIALPVIAASKIADTLTEGEQSIAGASAEDKAKIQEQLNKFSDTLVISLLPQLKPVDVNKAVEQANKRFAEVRKNMDEAEAHQHVLMSVLLLNYVER